MYTEHVPGAANGPKFKGDETKEQVNEIMQKAHKECPRNGNRGEHAHLPCPECKCVHP